MRDKLKGILIGIAAVAALAGGGVAIAGAAGGADDDGTERAITGQALDSAKSAALDHVGEGRVTATEADDEEGAYEVEVTRPGGSQVDVHLDKGFNVTAQENEGHESADDDGDAEVED